jgi:hypothetical protein
LSSFNRTRSLRQGNGGQERGGGKDQDEATSNKEAGTVPLMKLTLKFSKETREVLLECLVLLVKIVGDVSDVICLNFIALIHIYYVKDLLLDLLLNNHETIINSAMTVLRMIVHCTGETDSKMTIRTINL